MGFSKDPLTRLEAFHPRWFETFDLDRGFLIESDSQWGARELELLLRGPLVEHKAPMPSTVRKAAGGHTEWLRGAFAALEKSSFNLEKAGYTIQRPSRPWLSGRLAERLDKLYSWSIAQWSAAQIIGDADGPLVECLENTLDAYAALGIVDVTDSLPDEVAHWYRGRDRS